MQVPKSSLAKKKKRGGGGLNGSNRGGSSVSGIPQYPFTMNLGSNYSNMTPMPYQNQQSLYPAPPKMSYSGASPYSQDLLSGIDISGIPNDDTYKRNMIGLLSQKAEHQSGILRWYRALSVLTTIVVLFIVVGIIGSLWISVDFASVLGASYLAGTIMLSGGLLLGVWSDQNYATVRSYSIIRIFMDATVIVLEAIYFALQLTIIISKCPAPPDPVSLFNCTNAYGLLITSVVYSGLAMILILILLIAEIVLHVKVKNFARWKVNGIETYGTPLMQIIMRSNESNKPKYQADLSIPPPSITQDSEQTDLESNGLVEGAYDNMNGDD